MDPYKKMYSTLFNAVTDILTLLETTPSLSIEQVSARLKQAQIRTEELYLEGENPEKPTCRIGQKSGSFFHL